MSRLRSHSASPVDTKTICLSVFRTSKCSLRQWRMLTPQLQVANTLLASDKLVYDVSIVVTLRDLVIA